MASSNLLLSGCVSLTIPLYSASAPSALTVCPMASIAPENLPGGAVCNRTRTVSSGWHTKTETRPEAVPAVMSFRAASMTGGEGDTVEQECRKQCGSGRRKKLKIRKADKSAKSGECESCKNKRRKEQDSASQHTVFTIGNSDLAESVRSRNPNARRHSWLMERFRK
jgi:hypothetical protein